MDISYYGVALSDNIARTDEGYVICKDVVIGRTGYQEYPVSQLSKSQLRDLGLLDRFNDPDEIVQVWRDPDEVFAPATIASFEGKPVTDNHPKEFVDADSHAELQRGHVQHIRRGETPLNSGDIPKLADMIITDPDLGEDVLQRRKRELSCGYTYKLAWDGNRLSQTQITGNHVAVVPKGRAGAEARINDSADIPQPQRKQKMKIRDWFFSKGITAMAEDNVEPEQIAAAATAFAKDEAPEQKEEKVEEKKAEDADPLAEVKDSLKGIADGMKSVCDRLDKLESPESEEESEDEDPKADEEPESEEEEAESEDADEDEKEEAEDSKAEDAFIAPAASESDLIKILKPLVARSNDAPLKKAFNEAIAKANDSVRGGSPKGAYGAVKSAAEKKSAAANDSQDANAAYIARLNEKAQAAWSGQNKEVK
jgi:hypothetical protein